MRSRQSTAGGARGSLSIWMSRAARSAGRRGGERAADHGALHTVHVRSQSSSKASVSINKCPHANRGSSRKGSQKNTNRSIADRQKDEALFSSRKIVFFLSVKKITRI